MTKTTDKPRALIPLALRRQWTRLILRDVHFADRYRRLDNLYRIRDPWEMEAESQRVRFRETNRLISTHFGHIGSLLEVGCGEGHQTEQLLRICDQLVGVDVSARALQRARSRCPGASFLAADLFAGDSGLDRRFELVVACEVLYYVQDVPAALARLRQLGDACLLTYYHGPAEQLDQHVLSIPGVQSASIRYETSDWTVAWWRNQP